MPVGKCYIHFLSKASTPSTLNCSRRNARDLKLCHAYVMSRACVNVSTPCLHNELWSERRTISSQRQVKGSRGQERPQKHGQQDNRAHHQNHGIFWTLLLRHSLEGAWLTQDHHGDGTYPNSQHPPGA
jgi:hypothetical protein